MLSSVANCCSCDRAIAVKVYNDVKVFVHCGVATWQCIASRMRICVTRCHLFFRDMHLLDVSTAQVCVCFKVSPHRVCTMAWLVENSYTIQAWRFGTTDFLMTKWQVQGQFYEACDQGS